MTDRRLPLSLVVTGVGASKHINMIGISINMYLVKVIIAAIQPGGAHSYGTEGSP